MPESRSHKITARRIANKLNTDYNNGEGVDIKSKKAIVKWRHRKQYPMHQGNYKVIAAQLTLQAQTKKL